MDKNLIYLIKTTYDFDSLVLTINSRLKFSNQKNLILYPQDYVLLDFENIAQNLVELYVQNHNKNDLITAAKIINHNKCLMHQIIKLCYLEAANLLKHHHFKVKSGLHNKLIFQKPSMHPAVRKKSQHA